MLPSRADTRAVASGVVAGIVVTSGVGPAPGAGDGPGSEPEPGSGDGPASSPGSGDGPGSGPGDGVGPGSGVGSGSGCGVGSGSGVGSGPGPGSPSTSPCATQVSRLYPHDPSSTTIDPDAEPSARTVPYREWSSTPSFQWMPKGWSTVISVAGGPSRPISPVGGVPK